MFINPHIVIENKWIEFPAWMSEEQQQKCIQPNAIDFTLDKLFVVPDDGVALISEHQRSLRLPQEISPTNGVWELYPNLLYDGVSDFYVKVPDNVAAMLIIRSTFNRVGLQLTSGLYDSFFAGNIGYTLYNRSGILVTAPGTRIGQIAFMDASASGRYAGGYNTSNGQHWSAVNNVNFN